MSRYPNPNSEALSLAIIAFVYSLLLVILRMPVNWLTLGFAFLIIILVGVRLMSERRDLDSFKTKNRDNGI